MFTTNALAKKFHHSTRNGNWSEEKELDEYK